MTIEFACPQGHKIVAEEAMIGRGVKCPKCDAAFKVPDPSGLSTGATGSDEIEFLCPHGHKLSGPANLQGKAGKCPHCDARFIIPDYSKNEDPAELDANNNANVADTTALPDLDDLQPLDGIASQQEVADLPAAQNPIAMLQESAAANPFAFVDNSAAEEPTATVAPGPATMHAMAYLFESLWARRAPGVHVEFHTTNGDKIRPDYYSQDLSRQLQGVFGIKQEDGTYMITAVAWDSVQRITLRGVPDFPSDVFPSH